MPGCWARGSEAGEGSLKRGHVLAANGIYLFPQSWPDLARIIIGTGLFLGLAAALVVALGSILRRSAATVIAGFVLLVLPGILATATGLPAGAGSWLMRVTPTAAFAIQATLPRSSLVTAAYIPANGYFPISPWAGLSVLAAYTAMALAAAAWSCGVRAHTNRAAPPPAAQNRPAEPQVSEVRRDHGHPPVPSAGWDSGHKHGSTETRSGHTLVRQPPIRV